MTAFRTMAIGSSFVLADVASLYPQERDRKIDTHWVHCSASDRPEYDSALVMDQWHRERGFVQIGYHAFIRKDGTYEYGRPWNKTPAAQEGHNLWSFACCLHGLEKHLFTVAQKAALRDLAVELDRVRSNRKMPPARWRGHNEVAAKACPVIDYRRVLGLDAKGYLDNSSTDYLVADPARSSDDSRTTEFGFVQKFDFGPRVREVQRQLNAHAGNSLRVDGIFGVQTERAVRAFQLANRLTVTGIVDFITWSKLLKSTV